MVLAASSGCRNCADADETPPAVQPSTSKAADSVEKKEEGMAVSEESGPVALPAPETTGSVTLEQALARRVSVREYGPEPVTLREVAQLLWAAQGITRLSRFRTAPSAGATYPLETYVVVGRAEGLEAGIYRYDGNEHQLVPVVAGDHRGALSRASLGQSCIVDAPLSVVFTAIYHRTTARYGTRGRRYVHMEVGHAGENLYLQAVTLGLGTVAVGAFDDESVRRLLDAPEEEVPLAVYPVGRP